MIIFGLVECFWHDYEIKRQLLSIAHPVFFIFISGSCEISSEKNQPQMVPNGNGVTASMADDVLSELPPKVGKSSGLCLDLLVSASFSFIHLNYFPMDKR